MTERLSNFFCPDILPVNNDRTKMYKLIKEAEYRDNYSYMHIKTHDELWTEEEAEKYVELCNKVGRKSIVAELIESESLKRAR